MAQSSPAQGLSWSWSGNDLRISSHKQGAGPDIPYVCPSTPKLDDALSAMQVPLRGLVCGRVSASSSRGRAASMTCLQACSMCFQGKIMNDSLSESSLLAICRPKRHCDRCGPLPPRTSQAEKKERLRNSFFFKAVCALESLHQEADPMRTFSQWLRDINEHW